MKNFLREENVDFFKNIKLINNVPVKVAMIDTGIDTNNPFFSQLNVSNINDIQYNWHGTAVASVIAMTNSKTIIRNYGQERMNVRDLPGLIEQAISDGNSVINISMNTLVNAEIREYSVLIDTLNNLIKNSDVRVVVAAGNDNLDLDCLEKEKLYLIPAMLDGVITVGALGYKNKGRASYSNHGKRVNVYLPGGEVDYQITVAGSNKGNKCYGTSISAGIASGLISGGFDLC